MKIKTSKIQVLCILCLCTILLSTGCATNIAGTETNLVSHEYEEVDFNPENGEGYIYGRFFRTRYIDGNKTSAGGLLDFSKESNSTYAIVLENKGTQERFSFILESTSNETIQMSAVPPGTYVIASSEKIDGNGNIISSTSDTSFLGLGGNSQDEKQMTETEQDFFTIMSNYEKEFIVEENTAVYLGDFILAYHYHMQKYYMGSTSMTYHYFTFDFYPPLDRYAETTKALYEKYPFLNNDKYTTISHMDTVTTYLPWDKTFWNYDIVGKFVEKN